MRIILKIIILCTLSVAYEANIGIMGQEPKGELKEQGVPMGFGINFNGVFYPVSQLQSTSILGWGLNVGYGEYGSTSRQIPFNYFSDLITITEKTKNTMGHWHFFLKFIPFNIGKTSLSKWSVKPFCEGLVGFKHLSTTTKLYNNNCSNDPETNYDDCEIASSRNASDWAFSYGLGLGLDLLFNKIDDPETLQRGDLYFFINGRYLWGNKAQYLKEGDIEFSDPEEGPVETTFNWNKSNTDLLHITIGLGFRF